MEFNGVQSLAEAPVKSYPTGLDRQHFLEPLRSVGAIELIGWQNFDPVFRHTEDGQFWRGIADIDNLLDAGRLKSAGLRAIILGADEPLDAAPRPLNRAVGILKVENWWENCIDNGVLHEAAEWGTDEPIMEFIDEREADMSAQIRSYTTPDYVHLKESHEVVGGEFGQYQYLGYSLEYAEDDGQVY